MFGLSSSLLWSLPRPHKPCALFLPDSAVTREPVWWLTTARARAPWVKAAGALPAALVACIAAPGSRKGVTNTPTQAARTGKPRGFSHDLSRWLFSLGLLLS